MFVSVKLDIFEIACDASKFLRSLREHLLNLLSVRGCRTKPLEVVRFEALNMELMDAGKYMNLVVLTVSTLLNVKIEFTLLVINAYGCSGVSSFNKGVNVSLAYTTSSLATEEP